MVGKNQTPEQKTRNKILKSVQQGAGFDPTGQSSSLMEPRHPPDESAAINPASCRLILSFFGLTLNIILDDGFFMKYF